MVKKICEKCGLEFYKTSNYKRHLNKKYNCIVIRDEMEPSNSDLEICRNLQKFAEINKAPIMEPLNINNSFNLKNKIDICETNLQINSEILKTEQISINVKKSNNNYSCIYCNNKFSSKYTLSRHLNDNCKIKKQNEKDKENIFKFLLDKDKKKDKEINELKKQNKLLMDKLDKLINNKTNLTKITANSNNNSNNINSNNTQNIVMVNFGKEDLSIIDKKIFLERIVKGRVSGVKIPEEILKIIHFNPNYPQLSNIYMSDINREKCMVWEDGDWKLSPVDKIPEVIDKVVLYSNEMNDDLREEYQNNKKINDRLDVIKKYNNMIDSEYIEELKEDIEYNKELIKRCEDFQKLTYDTFKTTLYNEGKKIKKN
jgi:hypothetical protein